MYNPRWLLGTLIVSVAVNLALIGFVAGRLTMPGPAPATLDPSIGVFRVLRELPEERSGELRPLIRKHFRGLRGDIRDMRAAQRRINDVLVAEPFDAQALDAALDAFRSALLAAQRDNHAMLVRVAGIMTAEERALLRDSMTRHGPVPRRLRPSGRHDGHGEPQ